MLYSLQAYRGLAVLLVVLYHGTNIVARRYGLAPLNDVFSFGFSGVHLFFVLSGFIILTAHIRDIDTPARLGWYVKRRLIRIYPIYWIAFLFLGGWKLISVKPDIENFLLNAFLFTANGKLVIPVSWTLRYEIIFYAMFAVLVVSKRVGIVVVAAWFLAILSNFGNASLVILDPFNLLFIFGLTASALFFRLKHVDTRAVNLIAATSLAAGALLFLGTAFYYSTLGVDEGAWPQHSVTILGFGLASALLVLASASPAIDNFFRERDLLQLIGNASYSIYLVHLPAEKSAYSVIQSINPMVGKDGAQSQIASDLQLLYIAIVGVLAGILLHLKVERPLLDFLRRRLKAGRPA